MIQKTLLSKTESAASFFTLFLRCRKKMDEKGGRPEDIQSVDDLHKLPFMTKEELRVEDNEKAIEVLGKSGIRPVCQDTIADL